MTALTYLIWLLVTVSFMWLVKETKWFTVNLCEVILIAPPIEDVPTKENVSTPQAIYQTITTEYQSKELAEIISCSQDTQEIKDIAKITLFDIEQELGGRTLPYGGGFAKRFDKRAGAIPRPYQDYPTKELYQDYEAIDWFVRALQEVTSE